MAIAPEPYSCKLGDYYWKLATDEEGKLVFERFPTPFFPERVSEGSVSQASFPPDARVPYTFGTFRGGFGQVRQDEATETDRYAWIAARGDAVDEGVDASGDAGVILGPLIGRTTLTGFTPTSGYWFAFGTGLYLAATDGTNTRVYQHNTGTLGMDLTATLAAFVVRDAIVYRGTQVADYAYLAGGDGVALKYSTDGVTWTNSVGGVADDVEKFAKIDGQLARLQSGEVDFATDGGTNPTFAGPIVIGDKIGTGNGLYNHADRLAIGKSTGLFVLAGDRATLDQNLWADLWENGPDTRTFAGGIVWRNQLITPFKQGLRAISPAFAATDIGWDKLADNDTPVYGVPSGLAGDTFHLYGTASSGYLMKGVPVMDGGALADVKWHPILYLGTTSVRSFVWNGATGGAPQLFMLLANGQVARAVLSATGNPLTDSTRYRYCPGGAIVHPWLYAGFITVDKLTFAIEADGEDLTNNQTVQYAYRLPTASAFTDLPSAQTSTPGVRQDLVTPTQARAIQVRATLSTNDSALTPILRSTTLQFLVQPDPLPSVEMLIDCTQGAMLADGSQQRLPPSVASDRLWGMVNAGVKELIDPWARSLDVTIPLNGMRDVGGKDHGANEEPDLFIRVTARGQKQRLRGTWDRVEQMDWDYVADNFTWDSLPLSA